jgi:hypothetical protein
LRWRNYCEVQASPAQLELQQGWAVATVWQSFNRAKLDSCWLEIAMNTPYPRPNSLRVAAYLISLLFVGEAFAFSDNCPAQPTGTEDSQVTPVVVECDVIQTQDPYTITNQAEVIFDATVEVELNSVLTVDSGATLQINMLENVCNFTCAGSCHSNRINYCP